MAGPSVVVRVLGDLKGLSGSFQQTGKDAQKASTQIHGAFTSVLGTLNRSGVLGPFGDSLAQINDTLDSVAEHGRTVGKTMLGVGGTLVGVGLGLQAIGSKDQAAHQQLQAAVEATGKSYEDYAAGVEAAIKHQEKFGHTANQTTDALRVLTQATGDPAKALQLLGTAADLAAAKHEGLSEAAAQLGKTYNGANRLLKEFGVVAAPKAAAAAKALDSATRQAAAADDRAAAAAGRLADVHALLAGKSKLTTAEQIRLRNAEERAASTAATARQAHAKLAAAHDLAKKAATGQADTMTALSDKLKGQASASADTFTGKLDALKAKIEDTAAAFGQKYGPAITAAGGAVTVLGAVTTTTSAIMATFKARQEAAAVATATATAANEAETVALGETAAAATVADVALLPIIATVGLIVLAIAALGAIAYLLYRNWTTIWAAIKRIVVDVFDWIKTNWPLLLAILAGPFGLAALAIVRNWNTILDFFKGLPGQIASIASGMWKGIANAFVDVINFIIHIWNGLQFKIPGVGFGPFHTPSFTLGMPNIPNVPHLAQGGLITRDGLIFAHAGEAITPADRSGPAVVINDAHFTSDVDVELFMRRAAWVVQTQKI